MSENAITIEVSKIDGALVSFGNYLLSAERNDNLLNEINRNSVTHADIENWKSKQLSKIETCD